MFSPNPKNDPLLSAIKGVIAENDKHREAVDRANKHFKITDKRQLPHNLHAQYDKMINESNLNEKITKSTPMGKVIADFEKSDAPQFEGKSKEKRRQMAIAAKMAMNEALKGNQHKIDANKNNRIDAEDFKMLRKMDEDVMLEAINNLLEKDNLSESEYNTIMESPFGEAFKAARKAGKAEFEFNGKKYNSRQANESEDQWRANLAKMDEAPSQDYTIAKGDTLSSLAKKYNVDVNAIAKASGIADPNKLSIGQKIVIPGQAQTQAQTAPVPMPRRADRMPTNTQQPVASATASGTAGVRADVTSGMQSPAMQRLDKAADRLAQGVTGNIPDRNLDVVPSTAPVAPAINVAGRNNGSALFPTRPQTSVDQVVSVPKQDMNTSAGLQNWLNTRNAVKADQDQQLADRLNQADMDSNSQPKTTVDQYVKSIPSPDMNTSAGLQNWLKTRR